MNLESIISSLEPAMFGWAVLGAAALYAQLQFCLWAAPKVARFFVMRRLR